MGFALIPQWREDLRDDRLPFYGTDKLQALSLANAVRLTGIHDRRTETDDSQTCQ